MGRSPAAQRGRGETHLSLERLCCSKRWINRHIGQTRRVPLGGLVQSLTRELRSCERRGTAENDCHAGGS